MEWFRKLVQANERIQKAKDLTKDKDHEMIRKMNVYINPEFKDEQLNVTAEQQSCIFELEELR